MAFPQIKHFSITFLFDANIFFVAVIRTLDNSYESTFEAIALTTRPYSHQRILFYRVSIIVWLTSCLAGLDSTEDEKLLLFNISKTAESKQLKQEVSL